MHRRWLRAAIIIGAAALVIAGLSGLALLPDTRQQRRLAAQARWEQRPFANYRIQLQIERLGKTCVEELTVVGEQITTLQDGCGISWLPYMSVPTLFQLGQRLERDPNCYPVSDCACQRVRSGRVVYDEQLGYPHTIVIQRYVRPNWVSLDYWSAMVDEWALPSCASFTTGIELRVLALTPLP